MGHMSSSRQFVIMSLHAGLRDYHEVCTNHLSHSAISSIDCGKGSGSKASGREQHHFLNLKSDTGTIRWQVSYLGLISGE